MSVEAYFLSQNAAEFLSTLMTAAVTVNDLIMTSAASYRMKLQPQTLSCSQTKITQNHHKKTFLIYFL